MPNPPMIARHLLAILVLPFTVVVLVPRMLLEADGWAGAPAPAAAAGRVAGAAVFLAGFALFAWCVALFARVGRGTLAPWDPTRALVAVGPYRYVRNPMITGVATMLVGETVFFRSGALGLWAAGFITLNHLYFILSEEPGLQRRFGDTYREYRRRVPRWLPRLRP
jgi:protein-S-isoprenylcysteine O-methyltransferase Ste14